MSYISLKLAMLNIFSCAHWPSVCLLWRNVCWGILPPSFFFDWVVCFDDIKLHELFLNFGDYSLIGHICKYFFPSCEFSFHFIYGFICCAKALSPRQTRLPPDPGVPAPGSRFAAPHAKHDVQRGSLLHQVLHLP